MLLDNYALVKVYGTAKAVIEGYPILTENDQLRVIERKIDDQVLTCNMQIFRIPKKIGQQEIIEVTNSENIQLDIYRVNKLNRGKKAILHIISYLSFNLTHYDSLIDTLNEPTLTTFLCTVIKKPFIFIKDGLHTIFGFLGYLKYILIVIFVIILVFIFFKLYDILN